MVCTHMKRTEIGCHKSLHKLNTVLRCLIGPTLLIKMNALYTSKVRNGFTEVLSDLKSMKI